MVKWLSCKKFLKLGARRIKLFLFYFVHTHTHTHTCKPLELRHIALSMFGKEERTSLVTGICLLIMELRTTPGRPLSCKADS